jgi:hypothetical protein
VERKRDSAQHHKLVGSKMEQSVVERTAPSAPLKKLRDIFLDVASTPP